jgi:hypothetical protein
MVVVDKNFLCVVCKTLMACITLYGFYACCAIYLYLAKYYAHLSMYAYEIIFVVMP